MTCTCNSRHILQASVASAILVYHNVRKLREHLSAQGYRLEDMSLDWPFNCLDRHVRCANANELNNIGNRRVQVDYIDVPNQCRQSTAIRSARSGCRPISSEVNDRRAIYVDNFELVVSYRDINVKLRGGSELTVPVWVCVVCHQAPSVFPIYTTSAAIPAQGRTNFPNRSRSLIANPP